MHTGKNVWEDFEPRSMSSPWLFVSFTWAAVVLCNEEKLWVHNLSQVLGGGKKVWGGLLQAVVSSDCNISTWAIIDSGTTPARAEAPGHQEQLWGLVWRIADAPRVEETNSHPKGTSPYILLSVLKVHLCRWSLGWVCRVYTMTEQHVGLEELRYTSREKPRDEHRCSERSAQLQVTTSVSKQETSSPSC